MVLGAGESVILRDADSWSALRMTRLQAAWGHEPDRYPRALRSGCPGARRLAGDPALARADMPGRGAQVNAPKPAVVGGEAPPRLRECRVLQPGNGAARLARRRRSPAAARAAAARRVYRVARRACR